MIIVTSLLLSMRSNSTSFFTGHILPHLGAQAFKPPLVSISEMSNDLKIRYDIIPYTLLFMTTSLIPKKYKNRCITTF